MILIEAWTNWCTEQCTYRSLHTCAEKNRPAVLGEPRIRGLHTCTRKRWSAVLGSPRTPQFAYVYEEKGAWPCSGNPTSAVCIRVRGKGGVLCSGTPSRRSLHTRTVKRGCAVLGKSWLILGPTGREARFFEVPQGVGWLLEAFQGHHLGSAAAWVLPPRVGESRPGNVKNLGRQGG